MFLFSNHDEYAAELAALFLNMSRKGITTEPNNKCSPCSDSISIAAETSFTHPDPSSRQHPVAEMPFNGRSGSKYTDKTNLSKLLAFGAAEFLRTPEGDSASTNSRGTLKTSSCCQSRATHSARGVSRPKFPHEEPMNPLLVHRTQSHSSCRESDSLLPRQLSTLCRSRDCQVRLVSKGQYRSCLETDSVFLPFPPAASSTRFFSHWKPPAIFMASITPRTWVTQIVTST